METSQKTVLSIEGMTCHSCVRHVTEALRDVEGVTGVDVRLREGEATVLSAAPPPVPAMLEALREAGYEAVPKAA